MTQEKIQPFDLTVIGSGPGGYVCAIRAAQLGLKVAIIEKSPNLGGTCLNVGCIPSKALLHSTEILHTIQEQAADNGIETGKVSMDVTKVMKKKDKVVQTLRLGIQHLLKKRKITILKGHAKFINSTKIEITDNDQRSEIESQKTVIATGSKVTELPFLKVDGEHIISSDHGIALKSVPKDMVVIGAGAIGLELGSVWSRMGSKVTVVEFLPQIAPTYDEEISKHALKTFKKQGIEFSLNTQVTSAKISKNRVHLSVKKGEEELTFSAEKVLLAIGRSAYTENLGLENCGVVTDPRGRIKVNAKLETSVANIFAIGDVVAGPMLAHKAEEEGVAVAEIAAGKHGHVNYKTIPGVVYTDPEIACVGLSEKEAVESGYEVKSGKFSLAANGRALATDATDGLVKVIGCKKTDRILGIQMIGKQASEMIGSAVAHMEYGASCEDLGKTVHAHPTISESFKEAALAVDKIAIHSI